MAVIDVGSTAIDRNTLMTKNNTYIILSNPANDTGTLDTVEIYANSEITGVLAGTFYGAATSWTGRDYETIGTVSGGSKQTFSGLDIDVETDDALGAIFTGGGGFFESSSSGYSGLRYKSGSQFGTGIQTYSLLSNYTISVYATGATGAATSIKTLNGTAIADIAKWNGIAIGDYKTIMGISNVG